MARLSDEAKEQINRLEDHYARIERFEAADRMFEAVQTALSQVDRIGPRGRRFPAIYDHLALPGLFWIKAHRYWFCYTLEQSEAIIIRVLYDQANIPGRFAP